MSSSTFYGENLRLARLISGYSLQELGERVGGTTRQYIQQLEKDNKKPTPELINALAYELKVEGTFFFEQISNHIKEDECHFRKLKTTLVSAKRECTARATIINKIVDKLDSYLDLPTVDFPHFEVESLIDTERAAIESRKHWGLGSGPIQSMVRVLENAGAVIVNFGAISEKVDALSIHRNRPIVLLNPTKSAPRTRMDLAHEKAHIILHNGIETGDKTTEMQADYFASSFLLPRAALLKEYGVNKRARIDWNLLKSIKIKWGVSFRAIIYRLNQLEIITPSQYRTANIHMSKTGQTKSEWYDDKVNYESPEILGKSILLLGNTYGPDFGGLISELGISKEFLSDVTQLGGLLDSILVKEFSNVTRVNFNR